MRSKEPDGNAMSACMNTAARRRLASVVLGVALAAGQPAFAQSEGDRILQSVDAHRSDAGWDIELRFTMPLRYVRHSPRGKADLVLIQMEAVGLGRAEENPPDRREALRPFTGSDGPPVLEVSTNATGSGRERVIEVRFRGSVDFEVRQGSDLQRLDVLLPAAAAGGDPKQEAQAVALLETARQAMAAGDFERAAQLYTRILSLDAPSAHPEAQEMLGLARERNGQRAHARAEYQNFLDRFPDDERAPRVRQRLQALTTASAPVREERRAAARTTDDVRFDFHGSLLSYYSRAESFFDKDVDDQVYDSSWFSDLYLRGRMRTPRYEVEASASGRTRFDFRQDDLGNDSRLNSLLLEASERGTGWWGIVGRQRGDTGVLGRFDGARVGYRPTDRLDLQLLGGFPTKSYSSDGINTDRFQVGGGGQMLEVFSLFDLELYTNYQNEDDLTYRAAIGGEIRHLRPGRTIVASLDYDAFFNAVNIAMLLADFEVLDGLSVNTLIEYRKSPILTLGNALIGQPASSVTDLHDSFSASQMKDLAEDRTSDSTTFTLGGRYEINDRFDVSGNWTASKLSSTSGSGGVLGTPSTGYEFTYYAQVASESLLMDRDVTVLGVRIFDGDRYDGYMLQLNGRYPVAPKLRLNPIFRLEYQSGDDDVVRAVPRLRLDYTWWDLVFDLDVAFDWTRVVNGSDRPEEYGYSLLFGIRYDF